MTVCTWATEMANKIFDDLSARYGMPETTNREWAVSKLERTLDHQWREGIAEGVEWAAMEMGGADIDNPDARKIRALAPEIQNRGL